MKYSIKFEQHHSCIIPRDLWNRQVVGFIWGFTGSNCHRSMQRLIFGNKVKSSSRGVIDLAQRLFSAAACPALCNRPLMLHVTIPNTCNMSIHEKNRYQRMRTSSFSSSARRQRDPYTVLGVSKSATGCHCMSYRFMHPISCASYVLFLVFLLLYCCCVAKEIKLAYYKEAKKCHPDLNPNDAKAKEKFQELSKAYEILSDEKKKRAYDYGNQNYKLNLPYYIKS